MAEKMADVNRMIHELEDADIDDDGVCVRYFPYKRDVPILVNALKMYRGFTTENKMEAVAVMFGKKLGERFKVERYGKRFDCAITRKGIYCFSVYENPYIDLNAFVLSDLLTGEAVVVDD